MNKIAFKFAHKTLTGAPQAEATYLNTLITKRPTNRLMVPLELQENSAEDILRFNQTSHLVAAHKIEAGQTLLKLASQDCVWTGRLNPFLFRGVNGIVEKVEELSSKILGSQPSRRNTARLHTLLRWLVDYFSVRDSEISSQNPGLQLTATHLRNVCNRPSFLDLPDDTIQSLLICNEDTQKYASYRELYQQISTEFGKAFPAIDKDLILQAIITLRGNYLSFPDMPFEILDERVPHHSHPIASILRPSFDPNTIVDSFFDFTVPGEFLILQANREIQAGEPLTVNCESKSGLTRQPRIFHGPGLRPSGQPLRLGEHADDLRGVRGVHGRSLRDQKENSEPRTGEVRRAPADPL